jgi:hypothetical protein
MCVKVRESDPCIGDEQNIIGGPGARWFILQTGCFLQKRSGGMDSALSGKVPSRRGLVIAAPQNSDKLVRTLDARVISI